MPVELTSIRKVPKSKTRFNIVFKLDGVRHQGVATIHPRQNHSIDFDPQELCGPLLRTGRSARFLASALLAHYRGQKLELPLDLSIESAFTSPSPLTLRPTHKPLTLTRAAG